MDRWLSPAAQTTTSPRPLLHILWLWLRAGHISNRWDAKCESEDRMGSSPELVESNPSRSNASPSLTFLPYRHLGHRGVEPTVIRRPRHFRHGKSPKCSRFCIALLLSLTPCAVPAVVLSPSPSCLSDRRKPNPAISKRAMIPSSWTVEGTKRSYDTPKCYQPSLPRRRSLFP